MHQAGERIESNLGWSGASLRSALLVASFAALFLTGQIEAQFQMKRIMLLARSAQDASEAMYHPIGDVDGDGLLEMAYSTGRCDSMLTNPQRWEIGRFLPFNRWRLLHADTIIYPPPNGIQPGYFEPGAVGDGDRDGLAEFLGHDFDFGDSNTATLLCARESRFHGDLPFTLAWDTAVGDGAAITGPVYLPGSLDSDSLADIPYRFCTWQSSTPAILENDGNNHYRTAWTSASWLTQECLAFGDFNLDGRAEIAGAFFDWRGLVLLWESAGDNQYAQIWSDSVRLPNGGVDLFVGHDAYESRKPIFFVPFYRYEGGNYWFCYLFRYEATGNNTYGRVLVDSCERCVLTAGGRGMCGDIDGDGGEEIVWSTVRSVEVYRALPDGHFDHVYSWWNDHRMDPYSANVNIADVNGDGYNEIVVGGDRKTSVLEVEAVRVLTPNGGETLHAGDTCRISWLTLVPPRCDSISLFLRRDSTYRLDTIATGLSPSDTPYRWIVPDLRADSCRIMAMAYGPGRQYDESDQTFQILSSGIAEEPGSSVVSPELGVLPNPAVGRTRISYAVPQTGRVLLTVYDGSGRVVKSFTSSVKPGRYAVAWDCRGENGRSLAPGIYFLRLSSANVQRTAKLVITGDNR